MFYSFNVILKAIFQKDNYLEGFNPEILTWVRYLYVDNRYARKMKKKSSLDMALVFY